MAIYDLKPAIVRVYSADTEIREKRVYQTRRRSKEPTPLIQYKPIENLIIRIVKALKNKEKIDKKGIAKSTYSKTMYVLEDLTFIKRETNTIFVSNDAIVFAENENLRASLFKSKAIELKTFATFLEILDYNRDNKLSSTDLAKIVREKLGKSWSLETSKTNVKIMLDWARAIQSPKNI